MTEHEGTETAGDTNGTTSDGHDIALAVPPQSELTVNFGLDTAGRWKVTVEGAPGHDSDGRLDHELDLADYPTDDPAGAVRLGDDLRAAYPGATVRWFAGVMDSLAPGRAAAIRAMEIAYIDRLAMLDAAKKARRSRATAVAAGKAVGMTPAEIARQIGWARSSLPKTS